MWRQAVADFYQLDLDASILWSQIGPAPLVINGDQIYMGTGPDAGEVTDIVIDPSGTSDQTIYITTDDGGIWKTTDAGSSWRPLTDPMFSISMGAIAMDPSNNQILYGGSGNLFDGGAAFTKGAGIYRSSDAGITWSIVDGGFFGTIFANVGINRIVCPAPDCLLVATNKGLFRSVDGGRNFGANTPRLRRPATGRAGQNLLPASRLGHAGEHRVLRSRGRLGGCQRQRAAQHGIAQVDQRRNHVSDQLVQRSDRAAVALPLVCGGAVAV